MKAYAWLKHLKLNHSLNLDSIWLASRWAAAELLACGNSTHNAEAWHVKCRMRVRVQDQKTNLAMLITMIRKR